MDSANNSSNHQSSSGGGGGDEEFTSHTFFPTTNKNHSINIHGNSINIHRSNNNNTSFLNSLIPFFDPSLPSFPLPSSSTTNPNPSPPANTTPTPRNPKKRSRASRRAPTTVLTTNTSNFRAMVQEFTGIPSTPFSSSPASSYPSHSRFDFSTPPFLMKPYPQKLQLPAVLNASSATSGQVNYQMPPSTSNFQSLLQSQHLDSSGIAGQAPGLVGSGWSPDLIQYGILGGSKVNNAEINKGGDQARGAEGLVESWICSSD